jgi:hypothetical protein
MVLKVLLVLANFILLKMEPADSTVSSCIRQQSVPSLTSKLSVCRLFHWGSLSSFLDCVAGS